MSADSPPRPGPPVQGGSARATCTGPATAAGSSVAVTGAVYGNIIVGANRYAVEPFALRAPRLSARTAPSRLLAAPNQVVDFSGRDTELSLLTAWRDDPDPACAVHLLHGPGGQGKTRLAAQFAALSHAAGWRVLTARHDSTLSSPGASTVEPDPPTRVRGQLVVIDYAERWPATDLLTVLADPLLRPPGRVVRVLLLARPAGYWWQSLSHQLDNNEVSTDAQELGPLSDTPAERTAAFTHACQAFAAVLEVPDADQISVPAMRGDAWRLVLTTHMAALAAVDAHRRGTTAPTDPKPLSAYLLRREITHWQTLHDNQRIRTTTAVLARAVYTATLAGPLPHRQAVAALTRLDVENPGQVVDDHRFCYPPTDPATAFEPLCPDRLGEDFLALLTPGHSISGYSADPWAADAAAALLHPHDDDVVPVYARAALTALVETAHHWPHVRQRVLCPLLREHPRLAVTAGGATLSRLAELPEIDLNVLEAIEALLPHSRDVNLDTRPSPRSPLAYTPTA